jgi:hypothetical protein
MRCLLLAPTILQVGVVTVRIDRGRLRQSQLVDRSR